MGLTGFNRARREAAERVQVSAGASVPVVTYDTEKTAFVAKALELELGTEEELCTMAVEDLKKLIDENSDVSNKTESNSEKTELVAKAQFLKSSYPKLFKAPPSAIPNMSVKSLLKSIAEAEAAIAAGRQE